MTASSTSLSAHLKLGGARPDRIGRIHQLRRSAAVVISDQWSGEVVLERESRGSRAGGDAELGEDVLDVAGDRVLADHELRRDLAIALARGNEPEHLDRKSVV